MHPVCFRLGAFTVHWYGVFMALGFLAGLANWLFLGRREHRGYSFCADLLFWIMLAGILGARVAYVLSDLPYFAAHPSEILRIDQGGLIFYGGFVAAAVTIAVFARRHKLSITGLFDFVVTSLPLAHAFGRIGCFLNSCCFGRPYSGPLSVRFPPGSLVSHRQWELGLLPHVEQQSLPVHPVQLYETAANLAVYGFVAFAYRRRKYNGQVTGLYLLLYPAARFLLEFFRGTERLTRSGLSAAQYLSLGWMALGLTFTLLSFHFGKRVSFAGETEPRPRVTP